MFCWSFLITVRAIVVMILITVRAIVVMIVWSLDLQQPVQYMPISPPKL